MGTATRAAAALFSVITAILVVILGCGAILLIGIALPILGTIAAGLGLVVIISALIHELIMGE